MDKLLKAVNTVTLLGILVVLILILIHLPQMEQRSPTFGEWITAGQGIGGTDLSWLRPDAKTRKKAESGLTEAERAYVEKAANWEAALLMVKTPIVVNIPGR